MSDKVLIHSRFPKAMLARIGQRFDLMDAAGKPPAEVFTKEQLSGVRALLTAGGTPLGASAMDTLPKLAAIICYGTGYDGIDLAFLSQAGQIYGILLQSIKALLCCLALHPPISPNLLNGCLQGGFCE